MEAAGGQDPQALNFRHLDSQKKEALEVTVERRDLMNETTDSLSSVIVLEEGAEWPQWISEYQRRAPNSVVVAHSGGESMEHLFVRVARHTARATGSLRVGVVACAPTVDVTHLAARERLCRTLLAALHDNGGAEVVLAANVQGSDASKHAIFNLAGSLCEDLHDSARVVRVRFSHGRPESGTAPALAPAYAPDSASSAESAHG